MTVWRISGVMLPDETFQEFFIVDGRIRHERVAGAETLHASGWITPGLVDAHCHIGLRLGGSPVSDPVEAAQLSTRDRDTGVLAIRDVGCPVTGDLPSGMPTVVRAGRHLAAPGRYLPSVADECDDAELAEAVVRQARTGLPWIKLVGDWFDPDADDLTPSWQEPAFQTAIASAHTHGARVAVHTFSTEAAAMAVHAGVDSIEHGPGLTDQLINAMSANGIALVPTMLAIENFRAIAAVAGARFPGYASRLSAMHERFPQLVRDAHEAGVPLFVGTDAGSDVTHGRIVEEIMRMHHVAGIPAADVLAAASWRARDWLELPVLDEGSPADLVIYADDPRKDLTELGRPERILLRGEVIR